MRPAFKKLILLFLSSLLWASCINKNTVIKGGEGGVGVNDLAARSDEIFASSTHTEESVRQAYSLMNRAVGEARESDPRRHEYAWKAARLATWLSDHGSDSKQRSGYASQGIELGNTAIKLKEDGAEGHYYRAISVGLFARENQLYGMDAMRQMQTDGQRAAQLDPNMDYGGPERLLGALYLRAPGPPTGIGSTIKALHYLTEACRIAPDYPENLLFLAEAQIKSGETHEASLLLSKILNEPMRYGDEAEQAEWKKQAQQLQAKIN